MSHERHDEYITPLVFRSVRLRMLQRAFERAEAQGNIVLALLLLQQAAIEMGRDLPSDQPEIPMPAVTIVVLRK